MRNRGCIHRLWRQKIRAEKGGLLGAHFGEIKACLVRLRHCVFSRIVFRIDSRNRRRFFSLCGFCYGFFCCCAIGFFWLFFC